MNFLQRLLSPILRFSTKGTVVDDQGNVWREVSVFGNTFLFSTNYLDKYKSWVYRAVNLISNETAASLRLYLMKDGEEVEGIKADEVLRPLYQPNKIQSFYNLIQSTQAYKELAGRAFWYVPLYKTSRKPAEIWPLRADLVDIVRGKTLEKPILGYVYKINGQRIPFEVDEVIPFLGFDPKDMIGGIGSVEASIMAIESDEQTRTWNFNFFKNSARPDVILEYEGVIDEQKFREIQEKWEQRHKGAENAHKVALLANGLKMKVWNFSQKEMDFVEQRKLDRDDILALFGIPKGLILAEDVNLANAKTALWHFLRFTIKPKIRELVDQLNRFYLERYWPNEGYYFEFDDPVPADREAKLKEYEMAWNKFLTINEIREQEGYEPIEGGDQLYLPFNLMPVGKAQKEKSKKTKKRVINKKVSVREKIEEKLDDVVNKMADYIELDERGEKVWKAFVKRAKKTEDKIKEAMIDEFNRELQEVENNIRVQGKSVKAVSDLLFDKQFAIGTIISFLSEAELLAIGEEGQLALEMVGVEQLFDLESERVKRFIARNTKQAAESIVDTTFEKLKKTLKEGQDNGEGAVELIERVRDVFGNLKEWKAEQIALSETMRANNFALEEGWRQSEVVKAKQWYTALDERVCPSCSIMHGKIVSLNSKFAELGDEVGNLTITYTDIKHPPLHPDCRCVLLPVVEEE